MDREDGSVLERRRDYSAVALFVGFLLLIGAVAATVLLSVRQHEAFVRVRHTLEVENQVSQVLSRLQDAAQLDAQGKSKGGVSINDPKAFQGFTLVSPLQSTKTTLIDMQGNAVRT